MSDTSDNEIDSQPQPESTETPNNTASKPVKGKKTMDIVDKLVGGISGIFTSGDRRKEVEANAEKERAIAEQKEQTERHRDQMKKEEAVEKTKQVKITEQAKADIAAQNAETERQRLQMEGKKAEEETKRTQMAEEAKEHIAKEKEETERLKLQHEDDQKVREMKEKEYEREHAVTMQQMKEEAAQKAKEQEAEMERQRQEHAQRMKQMVIDKNEKDAAIRRQQREDGIKQCSAEIDKFDAAINEDTDRMAEYESECAKVEKELAAIQHRADDFAGYKERELTKKREELQLDNAKQLFEHDNKQIMAGIELTGQTEASVAPFLKELVNMQNGAVATTVHTKRQQIEFSNFGRLITRECSDKLTVAQYFTEMSLTRFIPIVQKVFSHNVDGLVCKTENEFDGFLGRLHDELKKEQKNDDAKGDVSELEGAELAKKLLSDWKLTKYWPKMLENDWDEPETWPDLIADADELKECGFKGGAKSKFKKNYERWSSKKYPLISAREQRILREISLEPKTWETFQIARTEATKKGMAVFSPLFGKYLSKTEIALRTAQKILSISLDDKQALKMIAYKAKSTAKDMQIANECKALGQAATKSLCVTASMMDEFNQNKLTTTCYSVALGMEKSCIQVLESYIMVRTGYKMAMGIAERKPAHMTEKCKALWDAIDSTQVHIINNMVELDAAAFKYFSFVPRFRNSFAHFDAKKDDPMMISLEYVKSDCRDFGKFTKDFEVKVKKLQSEALDCIGKCVRHTIGAKAFAEHRRSREETMKKWLDKKAIYDQRALDLDDEFDQLHAQKAIKAAEHAKLQYLCESTKKRIESNQSEKSKYVEVKAALQEQVIGIGPSNEDVDEDDEDCKDEEE